MCFICSDKAIALARVPFARLRAGNTYRQIHNQLQNYFRVNSVSRLESLVVKCRQLKLTGNKCVNTSGVLEFHKR